MKEFWNKYTQTQLQRGVLVWVSTITLVFSVLAWAFGMAAVIVFGLIIGVIGFMMVCAFLSEWINEGKIPDEDL